MKKSLQGDYVGPPSFPSDTAVLSVTSDGDVSSFIPDPRKFHPFTEPPPNSLFVLGILQSIRENPDIVKEFIEKGKKSYVPPKELDESVFTITTSDKGDGAVEFTGSKIREFIEKGMIYACESPAHRGAFHLTEEFLKSCGGDYSVAMAFLQTGGMSVVVN